MMEATTLKRCTKCGEEKDLQEFGKRSWCRDCENRRQREWASRPESKERIREAQRRYMAGKGKSREVKRHPPCDSLPGGPTELTCCVCGATKPCTEFSKSTRKRRGYSSQCRACVSGRYREHHPSKERPVVPEGHKYCPACSTVKPEAGFHRNRARYDGLDSHCRECRSTYVQRRAIESPRFPVDASRPSMVVFVRYCTGCDRLKVLSEFYRHGNWFRGRCKDCTWRFTRASSLGFSRQEWEGAKVTLRARQGNRCAICRTSFESTPAYLDHDHVTGRIRGVLCKPCNVGLGFFEDSIDRIRGAQQYIRDRRNVQ